MRLSSEKIQQALLHSEQIVRDVAMMHFAAAYSEDRSVMGTVVDAFDHYGDLEAFSDVDALQNLAQSDASISWLVEKIDKLAASSEQRIFEHVANLSWILAAADAGLLKRRRKEIFELRNLDPQARETMETRTRILSTPREQCWQEFEQCCSKLAEGANENHQAVLGRAYQLLDVVAQHPTEFSERILASFVDAEDGNLVHAWKRACGVRAAGQMRLVDAVPHLLNLLQNAREEWVREDAVIALIRIGGDPVVKAVWNACALAGEDFQHDAAFILECVHSDLASEASLRLMEQATDLSTKVAFAHALLSDFSIDGLGAVRQLILQHPEQEGIEELREQLVAVCTLMEAELPELEAWRSAIQEKEQLVEQWQSPEFPVVDTWAQQLQGVAESKPKDAAPMPIRIPKIPRAQGVGRNDPCPCNSGKKYKKCCLRR